MICSVYPTFLIGNDENLKKIFENEESTFFLDMKNINVQKKTTFVWLLQNGGYDRSGFISSKTYTETNCSKMGLKALDKYMFEGPMGSGETLHIGGSPDWIYPLPGTVGHTILKFICKN